MAPVDFTEETILVKLTDTPDKPLFTSQDSMKNATDNLTQMGKVGFGKLQDMDEDGYYAISLPWPDKNMWLHISTGTMINGEFKEGVLLDVLGNELTVTELRFSFFYKKPPNTPAIQQQCYEPCCWIAGLLCKGTDCGHCKDSYNSGVSLWS